MSSFRRLAAAFCAALLFGVAEGRAEISVQRGSLRIETGQGSTWAPLRSDAGPEVLNPFGDARGDSSPALARNPVTGDFEAAWGLGGRHPGLVFARHDEESGAWSVARVPAARSSSRWAGRNPQLTHDAQGNSYMLYEDAETGQVFLASVARDSLRANPPLVLATPQRPGTSPAMAWDGDVLIIAFVQSDSPDRLQVHGITPEWDGLGRIPEGGEGIPGIPEPIFGNGGLPGGLQSGRPLSGGGTAPSLGGLGDSVGLDLSLAPPLLEIESLGVGRLLVTWLVPGRLLWTQSVGGEWSEPDWIELSDPLRHEEARRSLRDELGARNQPGSASVWARERRQPELPPSDQPPAGSRR